MIGLKESKALGRKIRQDDVEELAIPTWALVREAIKAGRTKEALGFLEYLCEQDKADNDSLVAFADAMLTSIAASGEEKLEKVLRDRGFPKVREWLSVTPGVVESLQRCTELQRRHYANIAS